MNDDRYTVSDLFTAIFGRKRQEGALVCMTPLVGGDRTRGLEQAVYTALNSYLLKAFVKARSVLLSCISSVISEVTPLMDELTFILRGADWMKELRDARAALCFPQIGGQALKLKGCWNPVLLRKAEYKSIVPSDVSADRDTTILLITGSNSGGKSVYLKSVGISAALAGLGLPVCAKQAEMPLFSRILSHFPASAEYREGKRTYRIVEQSAGGLSHAYEIAEQFGLRYSAV